MYIQGVTGGRDQTSGECSLGQTIPIKTKTPIAKVQWLRRNWPEKSDILTPLQRGHNRHAGEEGRAVREKFLLYFNEEGKVPWQTGLSAK